MSHFAPRTSRLTQLTGRGRVCESGCGCGCECGRGCELSLECLVSCQCANYARISAVTSSAAEARWPRAEVHARARARAGARARAAFVAKLTATCLAAKATWEQLTKRQPLSLAAFRTRTPAIWRRGRVRGQLRASITQFKFKCVPQYVNKKQTNYKADANIEHS